MRMFQFVSGHSSEQSTAHYSSRPTVSQLKGVSDTISNWFENHRPQRTQISVTNAPFRSKLESDGLQGDSNRKFSESSFSTPAIFKATSKLFVSLAALMTKTDLIYPAFFKKIVDYYKYFAVQFWCRWKVFIPREATLESSLTVACFSWTNHTSLLRIATNEIASFCIDNRLHEMFFSVFAKLGKGRLSLKDFGTKKLYL